MLPALAGGSIHRLVDQGSYCLFHRDGGVAEHTETSRDPEPQLLVDHALPRVAVLEGGVPHVTLVPRDPLPSRSQAWIPL